MRKLIHWIIIVCILILIWFWVRSCISNKDQTQIDQDESTISDLIQSTDDEIPVSDSVFDMSNQVDYPLEFPLPGMEPEIILGLPDSRLPGALRSYRGANARHRGYDFYTGKCGLLVVSAEDGIIIDLNNNEKFPSSTIRDSILEIALEAGFTPDPILENLHGCSITIYHGRDESGKWYYSRLSHLENFSHDWQLGDTVKRGEVIGYVGASGTSAQFKSDEGKEQGCHLHFEWHQINNGEDKILGFDERDNELKRKLLYDLFS